MKIQNNFRNGNIKATIFVHINRQFLAFCLVFLGASVVNVALVSRVVAEDCATIVTPEVVALQRLLPTDFSSPPHQSGIRAVTVYDIPITFHVVRRSDGSGGLSETLLNNTLRDLNRHFEQVGIRFFRFRDGDKYYLHEIFSDDFYFNTSSKYDQLRRQGPVPNTANVWFAPNTGVCGLSSFPNSGVQGTIMDNACSGVSGNSSTIAHELGHYFHLYHTHETAFGSECPDGTNCLTAGDLLCSTPADPTLSGRVFSNCVYSSNVTPPVLCGSEPYNPQTDNLMSYSNKACMDFFTQEQVDKMRWSLLNERANLFLFDSSDNDADGVLDVADNCPQIYNPAQIDADQDGYGDICLHAQMDADQTLGNTPLTVSFLGSSDIAVLSWTWDFGDGSFSTEQSPSHVYTGTGAYPVTLTTSTADSTYVATMTEKITVVADTVGFVAPLIMLGQDTIRIDILARNSLPVKQFLIPINWSGVYDMRFVSISTAGLRTAYFDVAEALSVDPFNKQMAINLVSSFDGSSPYLAPDTGAIASLYFTALGDPTGNTLTLTAQPYSIYQRSYTTDLGVYTPAELPGTVSGEEFVCGDADGSGSVNILDVTFLIALIFRGGPEPVPNIAGDANGNGEINISDITFLIALIFSGGPEPVCP